MNGFEEIQKIVENFVGESKQAKQQISEIENKRMELAEERNEKKRTDINEYESEINALGSEISELGNQSQGLQNKLDKRYNEVKKVAYLMIDNYITEEIRKIRKIAEEREELEEKIFLQKERNAKYELQMQEFYQRFGRMPELSENAQKEDIVQDKQCEVYKVQIKEVEAKLDAGEDKLEGLVQIKRDIKNREWNKILEIGKEPVEEAEVLPLIEEIQVEEMEPIEEIEVEEMEPIQEIQIEEFQPIQEIKIPEFEEIVENPSEENSVPKIDAKEKIDEIEQLAKAIVEQIVAEQTQDIEEKEIITFEENKIAQELKYEESPTLTDIIAKIEENEIVYIAKISNGKEIKINPTKSLSGNIFIKSKEEISKIKENLVNYAISEYKILDKKVIKKIDPAICQLLKMFAENYNYDSENLIYNYAMSFSRNPLIETETVPITYNFSYINGVQLSNVEKNTISKICKNAVKNLNIDVIGNVSTFNKIKYILKRVFTSNSANALQEGKY